MPRPIPEQPHAAWTSDALRREYNTHRAKVAGPQPKDESENFYVCEGCGQAVDMRLLGDVLYHDQVVHKPLPVN
jgi:hypothetical protein